MYAHIFSSGIDINPYARDLKRCVVRRSTVCAVPLSIIHFGFQHPRDSVKPCINAADAYRYRKPNFTVSHQYIVSAPVRRAEMVNCVSRAL
jgi:hypothetical protein